MATSRDHQMHSRISRLILGKALSFRAMISPTDKQYASVNVGSKARAIE